MNHLKNVTSTVSLCLTLLTSSFGFANCLNDYHLSQRPIPHHLPMTSLQKIQDLAKKGDPAEGWRQLGLLGDSYASVAAKVLATKAAFPESFYQKLIRTHWLHVNSPSLVQQNFQSTAQQHFRQYVEILQAGHWPDSDQILMSYLNAVRSHNLPDLTVFDAAWDGAGLNNFRSWQKLNHLPKERIVYPTRACFTIDASEAKRILLKDFAEVPFILF